jgi:hypothetical protein
MNLCKVVLITILLCAIIGLNTYAQKGLSIEISVQPQFSKITGDYVIPSDYYYFSDENPSLSPKQTSGIELGTTLEYCFTDASGIGFGFLYSKHGQDYKDYSGSVKDHPSGNTLNYL